MNRLTSSLGVLARNGQVRHMRRGVYQMFASGPDQLSGYCQQVPTMFSSSADWARCRAFIEGLEATNLWHPLSAVTHLDS